MTAITMRVPLAELMPKRTGSTDPKKHPGKVFTLYSIPAYDRGAPEITASEQIGSAKKNVATGDVLLSRIVPHIRRSWIVEEDAIASGEWIIFRGSNVHGPYLRHFLLSDPFHVRFMRTVAGVGGSLLRARPEEVGKIEIPLPPLDEQRRIAAILDKADSLRQKRKQAIALLDSLTQSIFLEMFGDPVRNPMNLPVCPLCEVATFNSGGTPKKDNPEFWVGDIPWVSPKDMKVTEIYDSEDHVSDFAIERSPLKLLSNNVVLIVVRGMILAHTVPIAITRRKVTINQDMKAIKFAESINTDFGFWCLRSQREHILSKVSSAAHGTRRIELSSIKQLPILMPDAAAQIAFSAQVKLVTEMISKANSSSTALASLFASLQHRAFTGEL